MPAYDPTQHPRGNPANAGQFAVKENPEQDAASLIAPDPQHDYEDIGRKLWALAELAFPADDPDVRVDPEKLRDVFRPGAIVGEAHRIYEYMEDHGIGADSVTREAAFDYASADTGVAYNDLYDAWVNHEPIRVACRTCGEVVEARLLSTVPGKCSDCVVVDVHNHRARTDGRMKMRNYGERRTNR